MILLVSPNVSHAVSVKSYSYDKYGNVQDVTDPRGFATQYHYDLLNRLEEIDYPDHRKVKHSYDLSGIRIKMEDHRGATLFEPDEFGRINKVTFPDGQSVSYCYDSEGNLVKLIYPDGTEVEYAYDLSNRLEAVKDASGVTRFEYDELSNTLGKKILPNGITTEYRYHKTRKISNVIHTKADGQLIEEFRYTYDENGNRTKIEKISPERNSHVLYAYDKLNRIVKAEYSDGFFESFSYDGAGNRNSRTTPQGTIIYEYDEENRLKKAGDTIYTYDPAGNLIEKSSLEHKSTYKYDFDNRLIFYSDESNQVAFEYDGDGNRVSKTVNGIRTDYVNDLVTPVSQVLLKRVQGNWWKGEKTIHYVYGGSRISQSTKDGTQFYLYDSIGRNVSTLISSSGTTLGSYEYDAFGGSLSEGHNVPNVYKYCGEQFDEETGLVFLRNRYYDPEVGRFISKDPRSGKLDRPATLNPYCYVENNPINFVDPWGFEAVEPETLELVIAHVNSVPGWFGGQGIGGHVFMEFPARKESVNPFFGNYPKAFSVNEASHINAKTVSVAAYCSSKKVDAAIQAMKDMRWTTRNNCVHTVVEGMKIMEFPHAEKIRLSPIPVPLEFRSQMLKLHERDPVRPLAGSREVMQSSSKTSSTLGLNFSPKLDYGGVSLSKTAELQLSIADITGAAFDASTGQIILFGPQDRYLPPFELDDLTVAVRSVYGIGLTSPVLDPGVSIGTDPSPFPNKLKVRYDGATANTTFGQTMFEADYLLKSLMIGKSQDSGQRFHSIVPGYSSILARLAAHQCTDTIDIRMWFVPEQVTFAEDESHKGMVFSDVRMKVLTEAQFNGLTKDYPACREFAEHFTSYFDEFARQFPVLEKLKQLGKITAIVKWLKDNHVPFDTAFFSNYQPKRVETPQYVAPIADSCEWTLTRIEQRHVRGHRHRRDVPVSYPKITNVSGGISYRLDSKNFTAYTDPIVNDFASAALQSRPSENDFAWSFNFPTNRKTFVAIAQSVYHTRKPGNVKKSYIDMSFPVLGSQKLTLQRFYNSFSEKESACGRGWRITPYEIEISPEKILMTSSGGRSCETYQTILVRTPEGEYLYQPFMFSNDNCPLLKSSDYPGLLKDNLDGTFTLTVPQVGRMDFDSQGRLLKILDTDGFAIEYQFDKHLLVAICHQNGSAIQLEYDGSRVVKASGPGSSVVQYAYHDNGQLAAVGDAYNTYLLYAYDSDQRLSKITDHLGNVLFEANYDDYNRAILVREGSTSYQSDFSLEKKNMKIVDAQGNESIFQFDDKDRLIYKKDSFGLVWEFSYEQGDFCFPNKIIDPKGGITECHYDPSGNPIYFKNSVGAEWRFFFDDNGSFLGGRGPNGRAVWHMYGMDNRLKQSLLKVTLNIDENDRYARSHRGLVAEGRYAVHFSYDTQTGQLVNYTNSRDAKISFTYHNNGQQKEVIYPTGYRVGRKVDVKGKVLEISDGFGVQTGYDYDESDRITAIRTASGTTHFTYDDGGNLRSVVDRRGFTTSYGYDDTHNLKKVTDAEGGISFYKYSELDQLTHLSLPNGSCKTMEYDSSGRLCREIWGR